MRISLRAGEMLRVSQGGCDRWRWRSQTKEESPEVQEELGILAASCLLGLQAHWKVGVQAAWSLVHVL